VRQSQRRWLAGLTLVSVKADGSSVTRRPNILPRSGTTGPTEPAPMTTIRHRTGPGLGLHLGTYSELCYWQQLLDCMTPHVFQAGQVVVPPLAGRTREIKAKTHLEGTSDRVFSYDRTLRSARPKVQRDKLARRFQRVRERHGVRSGLKTARSDEDRPRPVRPVHLPTSGTDSSADIWARNVRGIGSAPAGRAPLSRE
jgi:hypothetical protein